MRDLISRQALCDDLREYKVYSVPISSDESEVKGYNDGIDLAISVIAEFPSAEPEQKWIPVSEALPKEKEMVLITNNKGHVRCGQYHGTFDDKNYRWWWKHNTLEEVLAWMPLPEPWRGEE